MLRKRVPGMVILICLCCLGGFGYRTLHQAEINHRLLAAAYRGDPWTARELLRQGADPNTAEEGVDGSIWQRFLNHLFRPKQVASTFYPLNAALEVGQVDDRHLYVARLLLEYHANPNITVRDGSMPLTIYLAQNVVDERPLDLLLQHGATPNVADKIGNSLLLKTANLYKDLCVQHLLEHGADPNVTNADGEVPLMWAAYVGDTTSVALLLSHGADINRKNKKGQTALFYALIDYTFKQPAHRKTIDMLLNAGADVNAQDARGISPFLYAVMMHRPETSMMLAGGGDVHRSIPLSPSRHTIDFQMHGTDRSGGVAILQDITAGMTPLMFTARRLDADLARKILAKGVDVNARDSNGMTARDYAESYAMASSADATKILALLHQAGAQR